MDQSLELGAQSGTARAAERVSERARVELGSAVLGDGRSAGTRGDEFVLTLPPLAVTERHVERSDQRSRGCVFDAPFPRPLRGSEPRKEDRPGENHESSVLLSS